MTTTHVLECAWTWTGHCGQLCSRRVDGCAARGQRWEAATVASGTPMRAVSTTAESGPPGTPSLGGQSSGVVDRQHEPPPDFRTLGPVGSSPWRSPCRVGPARHPWIWPTSRRPTRSLTPAYARRGRRPFPAHPPRMGTSHDRGTHTHPAARPHGPRKRWRRAGGGGWPSRSRSAWARGSSAPESCRLRCCCVPPVGDELRGRRAVHRRPRTPGFMVLGSSGCRDEGRQASRRCSVTAAAARGTTA